MLTIKAIESFKPVAKAYKRYDEKGLYLLVKPNGSKLWRFKYRIRGKENHLALGIFPEVSLKNARNERDVARLQIANKIDPAEKRRIEKHSSANSFRALAEEWLGAQSHKMASSTFKKAEKQFESKVFPYIGRVPIDELAAVDILPVLRRIERGGHYETTHRVLQRISQVFRYAVATGRSARDPTTDLRGALKPVVTKSRSAITDPVRVGQMLRAIDSYGGHPTTRLALQLSALTFVRPIELRLSSWPEFDLERRLWRIPAERMKRKREHLVPLSRQAVSILADLELFTADRPYVFESLRRGRPISDNTLNSALKGMGIGGDEMTVHGFRAMASTLLHERGNWPEVIELQLAHAQSNQVAAVYNRSARLPEREKMMQSWADYLDELKAGLGEFD